MTKYRECYRCRRMVSYRVIVEPCDQTMHYTDKWCFRCFLIEARKQEKDEYMESHRITLVDSIDGTISHAEARKAIGLV